MNWFQIPAYDAEQVLLAPFWIEELVAMEEVFHKIAHRTAELVGSSWAFMIAIIA